jgi:hypothetical protein
MASAALITLAISESTNWGTFGARTLLAGGAGLALAGLFVRRCTRTSDPVLDLWLLRNRYFGLVTVATLAYSAAFFGLLFSFVLFLTTSWHLSVVEAGVGITPMAVIVFLLSTRLGRLTHRVGFRAPLTVGASLIAGGLVLAILVTSGHSFQYGWLAVVLVGGTGVGLCYPLLGAAAVHGMPGPDLASATAINICARQLGAALGVAAAVAAIGAHTGASAHRFHLAWAVGAGFALLAAAAAGTLPRDQAGAPRPG